MFTESVMPPNHLILCCPLLLPSVFPSVRVFSNEMAVCIRWPKYWNFNFNISPPNEYLGLISFRIDFVQDWWFDLLAVPVTFKSLLQHQSLKESILLHSAFFTVQLSHLYMSSGKTTALTMQTFVGKVMSLLLNTLSRFVIAFLPRSNCLLISWLQSPSAVILESKKRKSVTRFYIFPFYLTWSDGAGCHDLNFLILSFKSAFSPSSFNHNKRLFSSSSHSAIRLESFVYLSFDKTRSTGESEC